ncbi:hypothetical protein Hamer_G026670, partial [Homarus americanus]
MPAFDEEDPYEFFKQFEKITTSSQWPKQSWNVKIQSVLIGSARSAFLSLSSEVCRSYEKVKEEILKDLFPAWHLVLKGVGGVINVPLCRVYLRTQLVTGWVTIGVQDCFPVTGVTFLLGNDIAGASVLPDPVNLFGSQDDSFYSDIGERDVSEVTGVTFLLGNDIAGASVGPDPVVSSTPTVENNNCLIEEEYPDLYRLCAVTRSQTLRNKVQTAPSVDPEICSALSN